MKINDMYISEIKESTSFLNSRARKTTYKLIAYEKYPIYFHVNNNDYFAYRNLDENRYDLIAKNGNFLMDSKNKTSNAIRIKSIKGLLKEFVLDDNDSAELLLDVAKMRIASLNDEYISEFQKNEYSLIAKMLYEKEYGNGRQRRK